MTMISTLSWRFGNAVHRKFVAERLRALIAMVQICVDYSDDYLTDIIDS